MKTINKAILAIIGVALITGCSLESSPIDSLTNEFEAIKETNYQSSPLLLNEKYALEDMALLTNEEKIFDILLDWQSIKATQNQINVERLSLEENVQTMKNLATLFKDSGLTLATDEISWIRSQRNQLKEYREDIIETMGLVYAPIQELEGMYSLENIDLIATVFEQAADNLAIRLDVFTKVNAIISEVIIFLTSKVG